MTLEMEDLAFSEWPPSVDLGGSNPWLPAYGFQPPTTLLDKDDFLGNPDADLFLNSSVGQYYVYLETIQEETSDDLRSESDRSESRASPVGWLATDSETGSVIRIDHVEDVDCESDREVACVAKRRRLDNNFLGVSDDESNYSLSRSSSLLQFESLEKQCQDLSSSSPSVFSTFSYDSLEQRKSNVSPDSLDRECEPESDYYKSLKVDVPTKMSFQTRQSSLESSDSQETLETSRGSINTLKTWRSYESLQNTNKKKASAENLSEDSGYSDHLYNSNKNKSSSNPNVVNYRLDQKKSSAARRLGFEAYDGDVFQNFTTTFGVSYQDLTVFERYTPAEHRSPLIERFLKKGAARKAQAKRNSLHQTDASLSLDDATQSKYNKKFPSEPNLMRLSDSVHPAVCSHLSEEVCVSSVPKDLNLSFPEEKPQSYTSYLYEKNDASAYFYEKKESTIAEQNWDIADLPSNEMIMSQKVRRARNEERITIRLRKEDSSSLSSDDHAVGNAANFRREGSYLEAMANRVDMSDDEKSLFYRDNLAKSTIRDFDKQILKAISETSIQSFGKSSEQINFLLSNPIILSASRNVTSTPNLSITLNHDFDEAKKRFSNIEMPRKSSLVNRSTSASRISVEEPSESTLTPTKSFNGSTSSKGVHFSPIVAEVNWKEQSTERESSVSPEPPSSDDERSDGGFRSYRRYKKQEAKRKAESKREEENGVRRERKRVENEKLMRQNDEVHSSVPAISMMMKNDHWKDEEGIQVCDSTPTCSESLHHESSPKTFGYAPVGASVLRPTPRKISASQPALAPSDSVESIRMETKHLGEAFQPLKHGANAVSEPHIAPKASPLSQSEGKRPEVNSTKPSVSVAMEPPTKPPRNSKIGGFFSRLASFRFSTRKNDSSKKHGKKQQALQEQKNNVAQRIATKDDYIYIPLKGPAVPASDKHANTTTTSDFEVSRDNTSVNDVEVKQSDEVMVFSKPPLPRQPPPRVVGACAKRRGDAHAPPARPSRNIDCEERPMEPPMGLIETDLDTEVTVITSGTHVKTRSLMNLGGEPPVRCLAPPDRPGRPHKSMEFLLDKQNLKVVEPPENELQKGERVMSEHELRIQRSLQKLTVPDWYKQAQVPREGFLLNKKTAHRESRWTGTNNSKTTSLSSLGSSNQSPVVLSPTPQNQPFVRWSLSKLNSTASSPCASTRSSFNARQPNGSISPSSLRSSFNYRQPYMGWRSQERLTRPRTPAERLANTILTNHHQPTNQPQESPEIQTSIKEVTSAIVHYVSGLKPEDNTKDITSYESQETVSQRSRSVSPRGSQKLCWLESSFVGTRPVDTPQTPLTLDSQNATPIPPSTLRLDLQSSHNDLSYLNANDNARKPSPSSTTLEDVLDSLLGLPSSTRAPSPSLQVTVSANTSPSRLNEDLQLAEQFRRRSEGSEPTCRSSGSQRISFHSSPVLRCRYSRCGKVAIASSSDGVAFKNCHNCSYTYCSRTCRRNHWEKHRKTCLFSRVGTLCRQVIAAVKEQPDTLQHVSVVARRGYLAQGLGAVKCFFPCPEDAEKFLSGGLGCLSEPTYVKWADLLPSEMGPQLYSELVKMCKSYNPDSKLVLYVSVCVVSEAPAAGAIKWERQLVSRCGKMRLSKNVPIPERDTENPETLILMSTATKDCTAQRMREVSFKNIQRYLTERGVCLKQQYPDIYQQLCVFVEGHCDKFAPVTVYPRDLQTGKTFMCIIMPEADPESVRQVSTAGVRIRTVDVLQD